MPLFKTALMTGLLPLLLAAQAPIPQSESTPKTSVAAPKTDASGPAKGSEIVCKKFPPPIGSRIGRRQICRTQAEWDFIQDQEQEAIDRVLRKPLDVVDP